MKLTLQFILIVIISFFVTSCGGKQNSSSNTNSVVTSSAAASVKPVTMEEAKKWLKEYDAFVKLFAKASKEAQNTKDQTKIDKMNKLSLELTEYNNKAGEFMQGLDETNKKAFVAAYLKSMKKLNSK